MPSRALRHRPRPGFAAFRAASESINALAGITTCTRPRGWAETGQESESINALAGITTVQGFLYLTPPGTYQNQ